MKRLLTLLLTLPLAAAAQAPTGPAFVRDSLRSYVERGRRLWNIPGVAVAVVHDGQVVLSQGFGTRGAGGQGGPVDGQTLFQIASNSKLFTGTALAQLETEGKLRLDDPVRKYLPYFQLYDSTSTRLASLRDVLGHKLGTRTFQGDFCFWDSDLSRAAIIRKMRLLKPSQPFRQDYGYCNAGFVAAGEVVPVVSGGQSWESWVQTRLLTPLGMSRTAPLTAGLEKQANVARPFTTTTGPLRLLPFDQIDNLGPAASLVSCTDDLARWLRFQLDSGRFGGQRVLPWATLRRTREANTAVSASRSATLPSHFRTYGLGVFSADYAGRQIYWHTGGANGYVTNVCFVPEAGLGIVVLTNQDNQRFFEALRYQLLDAYLGAGPYVDRSGQFWRQGQADRAAEARRLAELAARAAKRNRPARPLAAYAGAYEHPLYGRLTVEPQGRQLLVHFAHHPALTATLDYLDGDTFRATYSNAAYGIFAAPFAVESGQVRSLELRVNEGLDPDPYVFEKK